MNNQGDPVYFTTFLAGWICGMFGTTVGVVVGWLIFH